MDQAKQILREEIKNRHNGVDRHKAVQSAKDLLINIKPLIDKSEHIAIYHAYLWEISLIPIISYSIERGKSLYQPITYKHTKLMRCDRFDAKNTNIFYPSDFTLKHEMEWYNLNLILVPLVAVDKLGYRLGKGGGYYDSTLLDVSRRNSRPILCGVGFNTQLVDEVPRHEWDIKLDYFVSDKELINFNY